MIWISGIWRLRRAWESLGQAWSAGMPCEPVTSGQGIGWMAKMSTNDDHWQWQGLTKKGRSNCSVKGTSRQTIENRWGNPRLLYIAALLQVNLRHRFDLLAIWGHDTYNDFASLQRTIIDHNLWSTTSESLLTINIDGGGGFHNPVGGDRSIPDSATVRWVVVLQIRLDWNLKMTPGPFFATVDGFSFI